MGSRVIEELNLKLVTGHSLENKRVRVSMNNSKFSVWLVGIK